MGPKAFVGPYGDRTGRSGPSHPVDRLDHKTGVSLLRGALAQAMMDDLPGVRPGGHQRMVSQLSGGTIGGAFLGLARHLTDGGVNINDHRPVAGTGARLGPDPFQQRSQGLVQLADMTPCERPQERSQRGMGHHPKTAAPSGLPRTAADQHDQYECRRTASTPPKTAPCDPDGHRPHGYPVARSYPKAVPYPAASSTNPPPTTPHPPPTIPRRTPPSNGQYRLVSCSPQVPPLLG